MLEQCRDIPSIARIMPPKLLNLASERDFLTMSKIEIMFYYRHSMEYTPNKPMYLLYLTNMHFVCHTNISHVSRFKSVDALTHDQNESCML